MNNYHIYSEIGRGKGSVVYKGREKKTIRYVAIKSVEKQYKAKVLNEVAVLYSLHHPNILRFLNWYETSKHIWLIVEYCTGGNLLQMLRLDVAMPEYAIKRIASDILQGLQFVHSQGYIYGDLKPSNVLVNEYGTLLLCDFGLAKRVVSEEEYAAQQAAPETAALKRGSPYYMAPELFYSDGIHSFASDMWAFGIVAFELATGKPPFYSKSLEEVVTQILETDPRPLWQQGDPEEEEPRSFDPAIPPPQPPHRFSKNLQDILNRCLEKDPAQRMTWDELRTHPWFDDLPESMKLKKLTLPPQPVFERLFVNNQLAAPAAAAEPNVRQSLLQKPVDVLRLSYQAKKNRQAENEHARAAAAASDGTPTQQQDEIEEVLDGTAKLELENFDTELNFSEHAEIDESESLIAAGHLPPSSNTSAVPPATAPSRPSTFREPARPARPSELDEMESQLIKAHEHEEQYDQDEEIEDDTDPWNQSNLSNDDDLHNASGQHQHQVSVARYTEDEPDDSRDFYGAPSYGQNTSASSTSHRSASTASTSASSQLSASPPVRKMSAGASRLPVLATRVPSVAPAAAPIASASSSSRKPSLSGKEKPPSTASSRKSTSESASTSSRAHTTTPGSSARASSSSKKSSTPSQPRSQKPMTKPSGQAWS